MTNPWVHVEHGFVIVRPDGRLAEDHLYRMREPADHIASLIFPDCEVCPARRVHSLYSTSGTTISSRAQLIIDRSAA